MIRLKKNEVKRNMHKATSAKLPVACRVCVCMVRSPPKCSFFTLAFYPNFVLCTIVHNFFFCFVTFASLLLRRTHGPSISTLTHRESPHARLPLCSYYVRTLCVKRTQVVYYTIVRVFKLEIVKRTPSPNQSFVL